jgi:ADP-ribosylglycohydrolase
LERALDSLDGLSLGDAFGEQFFIDEAEELIRRRDLPNPPWRWTDDTAMAISLVQIMLRYGAIDQDRLASSFGITYRYDPDRGYGAAMHELLPLYLEGGEWRQLAGQLFSGEGSYGNGAAMRVAPVGAFFADDLDQAVEQARISAEVTHAHWEGIAGAIAVAVAAAIACTDDHGARPLSPALYLQAVSNRVPESEVRRRLSKAIEMGHGVGVAEAVERLGNGSEVTAHDTVPFAVWCAAQHLDDYEGAVWKAVSGLGDRDTICAMVGGIVGARVGLDALPQRWFLSREPLPGWVYDLRDQDPAVVDRSIS